MVKGLARLAARRLAAADWELAADTFWRRVAGALAHRNHEMIGRCRPVGAGMSARFHALVGGILDEDAHGRWPSIWGKGRGDVGQLDGGAHTAMGAPGLVRGYGAALGPGTVGGGTYRREGRGSGAEMDSNVCERPPAAEAVRRRGYAVLM